MKKLIFIAALVLVGCDRSEGEKAEAEYELAQSMPLSADEKCAAERRVEQGYLRDGNREKYRLWRVSAGLACNAADLDRLERHY